jgi:multiple sugar transport system permease protein
LKSIVRRIVLGIILLGISLGVCFPIVWIVLSSFKTQREIFQMPPTFMPVKPIINNYTETLGIAKPADGAPTIVPQALHNSLVVSASSTLLILILSIFGAYALSIMKFPLRKPILLTMMALRMLPAIVLALPLYMLVKSIGQLDTLFAVILSYTALFLPFGLWFLSVLFQEVPEEIINAGKIDGCSHWDMLFKVVVPLGGTAIAAVGILLFMGCWNEFLFALILTSTPASKTLPVALAEFQSAYMTRWANMTAVSVIYTIPAMILVLFAQKYIIKGMTMGAVKG